MAYIETPDPGPDPGPLAEMFAADIEHRGYVPNYTKLFGHRPGLYAAWKQMAGEIQRNLGVRNYELATLVAARAMRSSYCSLAHGKVLAEEVFRADTVLAIGIGSDSDELTSADRALMRFARAAATDPTRITKSDIDDLRRGGIRGPRDLRYRCGGVGTLLLLEDARSPRCRAGRRLLGP